MDENCFSIISRQSISRLGAAVDRTCATLYPYFVPYVAEGEI